MNERKEREASKQASENAGQEEIIELTDIAEEAEEPIIELTDVVSPAEPPADTEEILELTDILQEGGDESPAQMIVDVIEPPDDDIADTLGVDLESGLEPPEPPLLASEQIEAVLERIVREKLSEKIDALLVKVIEKEVSKEVERIRKLLMDEMTGSEDV